MNPMLHLMIIEIERPLLSVQFERGLQREGPDFRAMLEIVKVTMLRITGESVALNGASGR